MIQVTINANTQQLSEAWNELTRSETELFAKCVLYGIEREDMKLQLLVHRFPALKKTLKKLEKVQREGDHKQFWERTEELNIALTGLYNFFYKTISVDGEKHTVVNSELTNQLVPRIGRRIGPADFSKLEIWEFSLAELAYQAFFETGEFEHLNRLCAILYRPAKTALFVQRRLVNYNGDPRQRFNDQRIDKPSHKMWGVSNTIKYMVALWFEGWLKQLPKYFPKLYEQTKSSGNQSGAGSWSDTILLIARNEQKEAEQVSRRNLFQFLRERELQIIEKEETDRELAKMKKKK